MGLFRNPANRVDEQTDRIVADAFGISAPVVVAVPSSEYAMTQKDHRSKQRAAMMTRGLHRSRQALSLPMIPSPQLPLMSANGLHARLAKIGALYWRCVCIRLLLPSIYAVYAGYDGAA